MAKGLSLEDVRTPLSIATVDNPKGSIDGDKRAYTIYTNDQLPTRRTGTTSSWPTATDAPLRVRDIGQAVTGPQDTTAGGLGGRQARHLPRRSSSSPAPTSSTPSTASTRRCRSCRRRCRRPSTYLTLSDRTQTIRASVADVQFTLLLTIALVVMVIFVFLRSFWATIIPSVTVPLALLGACALMWPFGYSLDNLSLMALTIAVGFVVDDAIVMLENITRYVEEGETAHRGRAARARAKSPSRSSRSASR